MHRPIVPVIAAVASLLAGFALASWIAKGAPQAVQATGGGPGASAATDAGLEARLQSLETAIAAEREARQLLEDEIFALYESIDTLERRAGRGGREEQPASAASEPAPPAPRARLADVRRDAGVGRVEQLTAGGFAPGRAEWLAQRESELRMEAMQARYDAARSGEPFDPTDRPASPDMLLRDEIGDAEFERFLAASGRPTTVGVSQVMEASPALSAGIRPGDEITHYDGERVFSTLDLTRQTMRGDPGEDVIVDVLRGGVPVQVVLPRGPLGIRAGRSR